MLSEVEGRLGDLVVKFVKDTPRGEIMAGSATAVVSTMREKGLMPQLDAILDEMQPKSKRHRADVLNRVINAKLEFISCTARVKLPLPVHKTVDRLDELLAQHTPRPVTA